MRNTPSSPPRRLGRPPTPATGQPHRAPRPARGHPQHPGGGCGVTHQRIHQRFAGVGVIPVTRRFAQAGVVIIAGQGGAHGPSHLRISPISQDQQFAYHRPQLDHRVLGGHRIKQGSRINHTAPAPQQSGRPRGGVDILEQPPRPICGSPEIVEGFLCRFRLGLGFPNLVVDGR